MKSISDNSETELGLRRVRVVWVGLNFGSRLMRWSLTHSDLDQRTELVGVYDLDRHLVSKYAVEYLCRGYDCLDDVLNDDSVDAVVLMTGPVGRADLIRKFIRSGKDVMTTKPFETDASEAASVLAEARSLGQFVFLNAPGPAPSRDLEIIEAWRQKYNLGRPVAGRFESWYKQTEEADGSWYDDPEKCFVAPILRLGIYGICDLLRIFGEPECVQVMESKLLTGRPTSDLAKAQIKFKNGGLTDLTAGWVTTPDRAECSLSLYFENGTIHRNPVNMPADGVRWHGLGTAYLTVSTSECKDGMPIETVRIPKTDLSNFYQWGTFQEAVISRRRPEGETSDDILVDSVRVLEAIKRAGKSQRTEHLVLCPQGVC